MANQKRNEKCNCGSGKKFKHCCQKNDSIYSIPTSTYTYNQPMKPIELIRGEFVSDVKFRFVKYQNADNVVLVQSEIKPKKDNVYTLDDVKVSEVQDSTILGAIEMIIPEKFNNKKWIDNIFQHTQPMFVHLMDFQWFKGDKNTDFEKVGDNVLEFYGYMRTSQLQKNIDYINSVNA